MAETCHSPVGQSPCWKSPVAATVEVSGTGGSWAPSPLLQNMACEGSRLCSSRIAVNQVDLYLARDKNNFVYPPHLCPAPLESQVAYRLVVYSQSRSLMGKATGIRMNIDRGAEISTHQEGDRHFRCCYPQRQSRFLLREVLGIHLPF